MSEDDDKFNKAAVMGVRCPHCGALPGKRCRTPGGNLADLHTERKVIVHPRFARGELGLKRGRDGTLRVFVLTWRFHPLDVPHVAVALARSEVAAIERLRLRVNVDLDESQVQARELIVTEGDQLFIPGVDE